MRRLLLLTLLLAASGCRTDVIDGTTVIQTTRESGIQLEATYHRQSSAERLPSLVLIHDSSPGEDRTAFEPLWDLLVDQGYNLLAVDLRSHGQSDTAGSPDDLDTDPTGYPEDVRTWMEFLAERQADGDPVDAERVGILGLGVGASLAVGSVQAGLTQCAVAISPRIQQLEALRPGLLTAAGDDDDSAGDDDDGGDFGPTMETAFIDGSESPSADDTQALYDEAQDDKSLLLVEAPNSAALLLEDFDDVKITSTSWCWAQLSQ